MLVVAFTVFRLLDWRPDKLPDERFSCEKTAVLKNVFDPADFDVSTMCVVYSD